MSTKDLQFWKLQDLQEHQDYEIARRLQREMNNFGVTENAFLQENKKDKENYKPRTLVDRTLELIDPTPNIHTLFVQFNGRFFQNVLLPVEVKWSNRMTSCAGVCSFHPRNRQCVISLSAPLLKLRPRKDLVETLLHEMIHGYLFLTNNNRDRDGHGPEFCKIMHHINKEAGTNITIYHDFHEEVKLYKQHWWRCNGPCQNKPPYFGTVRRAVNRAPGPNDFWWDEHKRMCNGQFVKIKEPEKSNAKKSNAKKQNKKHDSTHTQETNVPNKNSSILNWLKNTNSPTINKKKSTVFITNKKTIEGVNAVDIQNKKISKFSCSGIVGGNNTGQSNLLEKFSKSHKSNQSCLEKASTFVKSVSQNNFLKTEYHQNKTKDISVNQRTVMPNRTVKRKQTDNLPLEKEIELGGSNVINCPVCDKNLKYIDINNHLDECLLKPDVPLKKQRSTSVVDNINENVIVIDSSDSDLGDNENESEELISDYKDFRDRNENDDDDDDDDDDYVIIGSPTSETKEILTGDRRDGSKNDKVGKLESRKCLVCNELILSKNSFDDHLEECIGNLFDDEPISDSITSDGDTETGDMYPCPVCMILIPKNIMNDHLDKCLQCNDETR